MVYNYLNGTNWYKIWSNGLIEQGGYVNSGSGATTVTFPKAFKSQILLLSRGIIISNTSSATNDLTSCYNQTITNFVFNYYFPTFWYAIGY